jgi:hypothetical protein
MDIACIESTGGIKTLQLKSINAGRSKYPIYQFRDRKGLIKILRGNFFGEEGISEIFIQINSDCFANIYCLMAPNSRLLGETLSLFICATKSIELEVGKTYIDQLNEILNGCQKIN